VETGGHRALIRGLLFTPDGQKLFSAGDDKLIRVWDVRTGRTIQIIRGESKSGREGQILALALSRDGTLLAAAGWLTTPEMPGFHIRLYDAHTGALLGLLGAHAGRIGALAFSSDGRLLASGSEDRTAIVWDLEARRPLHILKGHRAEVYAVAISLDTRQVTTGSFDGTLKIWRRSDGAEIATLSGHRGMVNAVAISPKDGTIASGSRIGEVFLWDANSGRLIKTLEKQPNVIGALVFSADGERLLTAASQGSSTYPQRVWDVARGSELASYGGHDDGVDAASISPDQRLVATAGGSQNEIHIWELATGKMAQGDDGRPLILRGSGSPVYSVGFSGNGRQVVWGDLSSYKSHNDRGGFVYQLGLPDASHMLRGPERFTANSASPPRRAKLSHGRFSLMHAPGGDFGRQDAVLRVRTAGKPVTSITRGNEDGYGNFSYTFTPDGQRIISGGANGHLIAYDRAGKLVGRFVGHEGVVWSVATSNDGDFLVSGSADQTVRIWNLHTYELVASLLYGHGEWAVWLPQGYYTSSPGGDSLVGWQINNGADKLPDFYTARQLKQHFYRPDIVDRAIILKSSRAAVEEAKHKDPDGMRFELSSLLDRTPPTLDIIDPANQTTIANLSAEITINVHSKTLPVTRLEAFVNGAQVTPADSRGFLPVASTANLQKKILLPVGQGENRILIRAFNAAGMTEKELVLFSVAPGELDRKGRLIVIAIGVDKYPSLVGLCARPPTNSCDLNFAGADARAFSEQLIKVASPLHYDATSVVLTNGFGAPQHEPTRANIVDALDLLRSSTENDTVVIFLSGHGANDDVQGRKRYLFLPTDAQGSPGGGWRASTVLSWAALEEALDKARGRRMLFVDTCHAANAYNAELVKNSHDDNIAVFSASDRDAVAVERPDLGHGVFTHVILRGLQGEAARDREVRLFGLADFVDRLVRQLTKETQQPEINTQRVKNYLIARSQ
jgi:WD40 repeat protein